MKKLLPSLTALCVALLANAQDFVDWRPIGLGAGGNNFNIVCAPSNPDIAYQVPDVGSFYRTADGGRTWKKMAAKTMAENRGYGIGTVAIAPSDSNTVYASTPHMIWSFFGGGSFGGTESLPESALLAKFSKFLEKGHCSCGIIKSSDGGESWKVCPGTAEMVGGIGIDPEDKDTLWVSSGVAGANLGSQRYYPVFHPVGTSVCRSSDGGGTWKASHPGVGGPEEGAKREVGYGGFAISKNSPRGARTLYVCSNIGVFRSSDHGDSWKDITGDLPSKDVFRIDIFDYPDGRSHDLFATLHGSPGVFKSRNGAASWTDISGDLSPKENKSGMHYLCASKEREGVIYAAPGRGDGNARGVFKTVDGGAHWRRVMQSFYGSSDGMNKDFFNLWNQAKGYVDIVEGLSACASDDKVVYMADGGCNLFKTIDGGGRWTQICSDVNSDGTCSSRGMDSTCVRGLAFDSADPNKIYMAECDFSFDVSDNGGKSWRNVREQINRQTDLPESEWPRPTGSSSAAAAPGDPGVAFAGIHGWSAEGKDGVFAATFDAGKTWTVMSCKQGDLPADFPKDLNPSLFGRYIYSILPFSREHVLIAKKAGLFESTDGGRSWSKIETPIPETSNFRFYKLFGVPGSPKTVYACAALLPYLKNTLNVPVRAYPGEFDPKRDNHGGLYRSEDMGQTWVRLTDSLDMANPWSFAAAPGGKTLYLGVSAWTANRDGKSKTTYRPGALYKSTDAGKTWTRLLVSRNRPDGSVTSVAVHPQFSDVIYATGEELRDFSSYSCILRSSDAGKTWSDITGDAWSPMMNGIYINPLSPEKIYAATSGAGLFVGVDPLVSRLLKEEGK